MERTLHDNTLVRWFAGINDSLTKCTSELQALFFFQFLAKFLAKIISNYFSIFYKFTKKKELRVLSTLSL